MSEREERDIKAGLKQVFGNRLRLPRVVALGYEDETGQQILRVPGTESDAVGKYFIHELPGRQAFVGEAYLNPGTLAPGLLRFGTPVRVNYDALYNEWVIIAPDPKQTNEYVDGVDLTPPEPTPLSMFQPGLLDATAPPSMRAVVNGAPYSFGRTFNWWSTQQTQDFTGNGNIPTTNDTARYCLIQLDVTTGALTYTYATNTCNARLTHQQALQIADAGSGLVVPQPDATHWRVGYIKLIHGMTSIQRKIHIWAVQEVFTFGSGGVIPLQRSWFGV